MTTINGHSMTAFATATFASRSFASFVTDANMSNEVSGLAADSYVWNLVDVSSLTASVSALTAMTGEIDFRAETQPFDGHGLVRAAASAVSVILSETAAADDDIVAATTVVGDMAPRANNMSLLKTVVLSAMFAVAFIGNTATLVQMYRMRRRRSTINLLITHLATADLIVSFCCNVTDAVWTSAVQWYAGNAACKIIKYLQVFGLYLSTYVVVIISIDRCLAILDPMRRNRGPRRVKMMLIVAWVASAVFSLPQTYIFRVERGPFVEEFYQCVTFGAYTERWQEQLYSCLSVLLMFFLPLVTMVAAYMLIFTTIAQKSRDFQVNERNDLELFARGATVRRQLFYKAKVQSLRMTALIVVAFIVCWTPYQVLFLIYTFLDPSDIDYRYFMWIFFFGMANSMVNPLIYGACTVCRRAQQKNTRPVIEPRVLSPPASSQSSSTSKVMRYYLRKSMRAGD